METEGVGTVFKRQSVIKNDDVCNVYKDVLFNTSSTIGDPASYIF